MPDVVETEWSGQRPETAPSWSLTHLLSAELGPPPQALLAFSSHTPALRVHSH